jgi:outer membrane immunogenic protein
MMIHFVVKGWGVISGLDHHMRIHALSLIAGLASTSAYAADVAMEEPPAPVAVVQEVPIFSWTGGYVGLQGGGLWSDSNIDQFDESDSGVFSDTFNGGLFGGYAGYNWQSGAWVFGVEGDFNGVWNDETFNILGLDVDVGTDYLASLRGRVGYAFDRALIFATGGVAFTQFSAEADLGGGVSLNADQSFTGWTVGAGAEYAFTNNWIGRLEYRYYDFSDDALDDFGDVDLETNTLTVGVAYKF